ncbi:protein translocase subunit SecD [Asanoa iriomotensis]|uniref:Protein translocase subunit SecD n=2 Tax=Asanoa iriomotensis TaxID=234613 RepID=A0ABQ4CGA6_9ACTN|nr:protein translocase subunit SecD [Asanoa iriomotensis]
MAPPQRQMHPGRQLAVLAGLFVVLYALVFFAGASGSVQDRLHPKLGLDLVGGTRMTLQATTNDGQPPSAESLDRARDIIEQRVNARGVSEAEVVTEGNRNIVVSLPGKNADLSGIDQTAELRFRKVLNITNGTGPAPAPTASATPAPSGSATPNPGATPSAPASGAPSATATPGTGGSGGGAEETPTPTPSASATADPAPSGSAAPLPPDVEAARKAVEAKVGPAAWAAASGLQAPDPGTDPAVTESLKPFGQLSEAEVAVLTPQMQFNVPTITCDQLDKRPSGSISATDQQAVACQAGGKYLLDVSKVSGTDVGGASAQIDQQGQWVVSLDFKGDGQEKWTALTREAYQNSGQTCDASTLQNGNCLVAVVLDNGIISAPEIQGVLTGDSQISGSFTAQTADDLAGQLRYGALPLTFTPADQENLSPTLGAEYLRAGLIAAGIGLLLVAIYAFFYYRLLGTVIVLSLVLSAGLVFGALVFLGRQIGFTLTLAGIAGFIVSLGVAADSFVIYFERLKDEIREGRSPRSAVPRAWARARRTIISANAISIMAAVVLYVVSVGTVKGFAFALGLATILDLVVVFLFRHPIMTMFANTKAFLSPRVSGLGRVLEQHDDDDGDEPRNPRRRTPRAKEA